MVKVYRVVSSLSLHLVMMRDGFLMLFWPRFDQVSHRFPLSDILVYHQVQSNAMNVDTLSNTTTFPSNDFCYLDPSRRTRTQSQFSLHML